MRILLTALAAATTLGAAPAVPLPEPTRVNEKYSPKHPRNVLDFWQAKSSQPAPVVVWFHGGGFTMGDKAFIFDREAVVNGFLSRGVSVATCNYPFLKDASYEEILRHCARAIQFLRSKQKEWNIDPARIGVVGNSAGALISGWVGYHADLADPKSVDPVERLSSNAAVVGSHWQPMGTEAMVLPHLRAGGPPLFLFCDVPEADALHSPKYARMMKAKADELKLPVELYGGPKNDLPKPPAGQSFGTLLVTFFCKHLKVK